MAYIKKLEMHTKKKKCKGARKAKDYGCGELHYIHRYGLCKKCFKKWLYNTPEGEETLEKARIIGKKRARIETKKETKRQKIESKSIASLIQDARVPFQKLIRIRDHGKKCICCDRALPFNIGDYDAGHYLKAEIYTGLIFHPDNVHGQLTYCNKYEHGNESAYSDGLKQRIGADLYKKLESSKNMLKAYKWDRYSLIEIRDYYRKELRLVEKGIKNINDVDFSIGIINM